MESATAAVLSERNAAQSAVQAAQNATAAAQSASDAQNAVNGFGLQAGTTTTGEPGMNAVVEIQKTGTKYTANFTIPRGDVGPAGVNENVPLGTASGVVAQGTDAYPALPRKVQVHGRTVDGHTVEPTKLIMSGKNMWTNFKASTNPINGITYTPNDDGSFTLDGTATNTAYFIQSVTLNSTSKLSSGLTVSVSVRDENMSLTDKIKTAFGYRNASYTRFDTCSSKGGLGIIGADYKYDECQVIVERGTTLNNERFYPQVEIGEAKTSWERPSVSSSYNLPSGISLADGDTLTIDHDGTTQILHTDGEPTVLENVTLPELPAPTFNVYTTGGSIQPTVDVDYGRDINIVINKLEQAMAVQAATMKVNQLTD